MTVKKENVFFFYLFPDNMVSRRENLFFISGVPTKFLLSTKSIKVKFFTVPSQSASEPLVFKILKRKYLTSNTSAILNELIFFINECTHLVKASDFFSMSYLLLLLIFFLNCHYKYLYQFTITEPQRLITYFSEAHGKKRY